MFGTNGVRGKLDVLGPKQAFDLAKAFSFYVANFGVKEVVLGRDMRKTSPLLFSSAKSGILSAGLNVVDIGLTSTPCLEFHSQGRAGIMITASHNPPEWNGIKFVYNICLSKEKGKEVMSFLNKQSVPWHSVGFVRKENALPKHIGAILKTINVKKELHLLLDFGNGVASLYADLFKRLAKVESINSDIDGTFPGRNSEPVESNLQLLKCLVRDYDAGFAWDGDGDRFVMFDNKGEFVNGDKILALAIILKHEKIKKVITTVATSKVVEDVAKRFGLDVEYTKVGVPYLSEKVDSFSISGEECGGVIWNEISKSKDGIETACKMIELLEKQPLNELLKELPEYYIYKTKVRIKDRFRKMQLLKDYFKNDEIITIDGIRYNINDHSWVIIRPSGTEEYIRVFAESKSKEKSKALAEKYVRLVEEI